MDYPLMIDGTDAGTLSVSEEGLYTCFEARAGERDGLVRLWVCGGGECAYLGVMQPWSGGLYLRRRLSRSELKGFPSHIEYAADQSDESLHNSSDFIIKPDSESAVPVASSHNVEAPSSTSCPFPADIPENTPSLQWFSRRDGTLVSFDGISCLVALPAELRRADRRAVIREIAGRKYMVFRY